MQVNWGFFLGLGYKETISSPSYTTSEVYHVLFSCLVCVSYVLETQSDNVNLNLREQKDFNVFKYVQFRSSYIGETLITT